MNLTELLTRLKEMDAKRTQGVWHNRGNEGPYEENIVYVENGEAIALASRVYPECIIYLDEDNANFIAAAPEEVAGFNEAMELLRECRRAIWHMRLNAFDSAVKVDRVATDALTKLEQAGIV